MELSDKIRIIRKARGFSQEKLGEALSGDSNNGVSRQSISDWESGKSEPKLDNIRELAHVLRVSFDALLDDSLDLDDQSVLNSVLKNLQPETKEKINSKFRYRIHAYTITKSNYLKDIIPFGVMGLFLIVTIVTYLLSLNELISGWWSFVFLMCFFVSLGLISIPILSIKNIKNGGYSIAFGELNNTHLIVNSTNSAENTIYVPIEKIEKMELGKEAKKKHGPVLIYVSGRARPFTLIDIKNPEKLIDVFNNINSYVEDTDEIKIM